MRVLGFNLEFNPTNPLCWVPFKKGRRAKSFHIYEKDLQPNPPPRKKEKTEPMGVELVTFRDKTEKL